jgi:hypothetical protein
MVITDESETVRKEDLREVQDHQEKRQDHGHLREPQAQAETGLIAFSDTAASAVAAAQAVATEWHTRISGRLA